MNDLVKALVEGLIDENASSNKKIVGMFGGGFKPPTSGHLEVVQRALAENPELDELIILVGSGTRDSISQEESLAIWNIYKKLLPGKVTVMASPKDKPPIGAIYSYAKKNPNEIIYWFVGAREGNEEDFQDIEKRTRSLRKLAYQNVKVKQIITGGAVSGTKARQALLAKDKKAFLQFIPSIPEVDQIWDMLTAVVKERIAFTPDFVTQGDVEFVDDFADRKLAPIDVDLTGNHFFDRLNDPRNRPDISVEELEEFFDKLADEKEDFIKFLKQYKDVVVKDTDTNINIPFMKRANKAIAKTIMRKKNFMTSNKVLPLEEGRYDNEVLTQSRYIINLFKAEFGNKFKDEEAGEGNIGNKKYKLQLAFVPTTLTSGADFEIDGFAYPKIIAINIAYNPEAFPEAYNELTAGIKDAVRHELEHFGQYHFDKDAEVDVPEEDYPSRFEYLTDDYEVSAHVQGLYKRAKTKKVPFTDVLDDFLDDELDTLSPQEIKLVRDQYLWYAKNNLPAAQINEANSLKEIGEGSSKPFPYKEDEFPLEYVKMYGIGYIQYTIKAEANGEPIDIRVSGDFKRRRSKIKGGKKEYGLLDFQFGPSTGTDKTPTINDKTYMFRLIATLLQIIKEIDSKIKISFIGYEAEPQRHRLYTLIIKKAFPNATVARSERGQKTQWDLNESKDPKKGTGKKPKGSGRRLYTDEDPKDTVGIKFSTRQDIVDTLNKTSFKNKSHARQSQVINLIHQRVRAAYGRSKKPDVKKRLKTALDYITKRKEASKAKTQRLKDQKKKKKANENVAPNHNQKSAPYGSGYKKVEEKKGFGGKNRYRAIEKRGDKYYYMQDNPFSPGVRQEFGPYKTKAQAIKKMDSFPSSPSYRDLTEKNIDEGDTYEKMAAKGKKSGNLKQGTVRKRLNIPKDEKVPMYKINKEISRLKKMDKDEDKKGVQLGDKNQKYYKALQLAKTLKSTTNLKENYEGKLESYIESLTNYMGSNGLNLNPYPSLEYIENNKENAANIFGRTAYYMPSEQKIVLYTMGRHPKDILRSYAHELVHHHQNLNNTLDHSQTTNTNEDDALDRIEREAYENGNILFRNWEDSIKNQ